MKSASVAGLALVALTVAAAAASAGPESPLPSPLPPRRLRTLTHNPAGYQPNRAAVASDVLLGDLLFHSPAILGARARSLGISCQSCHPNGAAHVTFALPGLGDPAGSVDLTSSFFRPGADNQRRDALNIPSLRGARYTGPYGLDGRTASLAEFIQSVVVDSLGGPPLEPTRLRALTRYVQEQDFLPNRNLDPHNRLRAEAGPAARRGELLFSAPRSALDGASCATCHRPSTLFRDGQVHRIGSGQPASPYSLDDGYETPTLLGTVETAPYFHDGRFATLRAVVDWFNTSFALAMTPGECSDLTAYLEAIGAADLRSDQRTTGQKLAETSAYLTLLTASEVQEDRLIWDAALGAVIAELGGLSELPQPAAQALRLRIQSVLAALRSLQARSQEKSELAALRREVPALHQQVLVLGADLTALLGH